MTKRRILVLTDVILTTGRICFLEISRLHDVSLEMENKKTAARAAVFLFLDLQGFKTLQEKIILRY